MDVLGDTRFGESCPLNFPVIDGIDGKSFARPGVVGADDAGVVDVDDSIVSDIARRLLSDRRLLGDLGGDVVANVVVAAAAVDDLSFIIFVLIALNTSHSSPHFGSDGALGIDFTMSACKSCADVARPCDESPSSS